MAHTQVYLHCEQRRHTLFISQLDLFLHHMSSRNLSSYVLKEQSCNTGVHRHLDDPKRERKRGSSAETLPFVVVDPLLCYYYVIALGFYL